MTQKTRKKIYDFLRWSERYTKTDMVYLTKGGSWLGSGQTVTTLLSFLLILTFANFLPQQVYGTYKYVLSVAGIVVAFSLTGLGTATVRAVAAGYEYLVRHTLRITLIWSIPAIFVALGIGGYYFLQRDIPLAVSMLIIAIFQPFLSGFSLYSFYLNGRKKYREIALSQTVRNGIPTLILIGTVFITKNPVLLVLVYFATHTLVTALIYAFVRYRFPPNNTNDDVSLTYAKHLSLIKLISGVANRFGDIIIFQLLGAVPLAIYGIANALPTQIITLAKHLHFLALPKFAARDKEEIKKQILHKVRTLTLVGIALYLPYYILTPFLFDLFFPQYADAVFIARLLGINIILALSTSLVGTFLDSQYETKLKYGLTLAVSIVKPILMLVLLMFFGLTGVVLGELFTHLLLLIVFAVLVRYV